MRLSAALREQVRTRADFACEYCGVTETNTGDALTVDHHQPQVRGGPDTADNLLYCCHPCNQYKADYWPRNPSEPSLWHPRTEPAAMHFLELADGALHPLTDTGAFALGRLRLNRPPLVAHRLHKRSSAREQRLLSQHRDILTLMARLSQQQAALLEENHALLEEQRALLRLLIERQQ